MSENNTNINWFPGHMKKTRELIQENLKLVDAAVELLDSRIPASSRNPIIGDLVKNKIRIIILNKSDLADPERTKEWAEKLRAEGSRVLVMNAESGEGASALKSLLGKIRDENNEGRQRKRPLRLMIVGIPNVGKSSLINRLTGSRGAKTGNKPGVTRGKQWLSLGDDIMLLDTPGILWPKFEDQNVAKKLAFCGSIKDEIMDIPTLGMELIGVLSKIAPELLAARYKLDGIEETPLLTMEAIALKRGFILPGKRIDYERTARTVLDEFRSGTIGRISLE
ncbi:MAG: ribosome biogenesis GTPase YlqF [Firmicutes bacterium]|nr:ribosome biogenesis GTPase YlqF [Bacillota bacterium]